ncbi:hypothetical protein ACULNC_01810 [Shigella flexneri]
MAAWRQGGATLGLLLCTVGFVPVMNLIEGNQKLGYIFAATLFSLFGLLFMWIRLLRRERALCRNPTNQSGAKAWPVAIFPRNCR